MVCKEDRVAGVLTAGKYFTTSFLSLFCILMLYAVMPSAVQAAPGDIVTIAGGGTGGLGDDGLATSATLSYPTRVSIDISGNIYIADYANNRIRKVDHNSGIITTVAGNGTAGYSGDNGPATSASLRSPLGVSVDASGNIYIADTDNNRIRKVDISGTISTLAGNGTPTFAGDNGPATSASLNFPVGVSVDTSGNIYIADTDNHRIRKVDISGTISTLAGNGTPTFAGDGGDATLASLNLPTSVSVNDSGNIYIADFANNRIREVYSSGTITTVAGNGTVTYSGDGVPATSASLYAPYGVAVDALGNIFIADTFHSRVRKVDTLGIITTVTGNGTWAFSGDNGPAASAAVNRPYGVLVDAAENIYIADTYNNRIRKVLALAPSINVTDSIAPISDLQMNFGNTIEGTSSPSQTITISNTGSADLTVTNIQIAGTDADQFSLYLSGGTAPCYSATPTVTAGSYCTVSVTFSPTSTGTKSAALAIASNDLSAATVSVSMSGTGTAIPVPQIAVTDSVAPIDDHQIPFGNVTQGMISNQTVTVTNSGNADLNIFTINQPSAPFSIPTDNCSGQTISPASTCTLTVRFAPTTVGTFSSNFDIPSNDSVWSSITVTLNGTGTAIPVPQIAVTDSVAPINDHQIPFGNVTQGMISNQTVTVTNNGNADLVIGTINSPSAPFSIPTGDCSGKTIAPASTCTLTVRFAPTTVGTFNSSFDIPSDDPVWSSVTVTLSGTGFSSVTNNPPSAPTLVFPANQQAGLGTTVSFRWKKSTDPDGDAVSYHLYTCMDSNLTNCNPPVDVASSGASQIYLAGFGMYGGLMMIGMVFAGSRKGRKGLLLLIVIVLLTTGITLASCGGGSSSTPSPSPTNEISYTMTNLSPGTTYYWKVVADDSKGGTTASQVWSFSTQ
jgi:hypothetical protein